jgi:hypothetical protein
MYAKNALRLSASGALPACSSKGVTLSFAWDEPSSYLPASTLVAISTANPRVLSIPAATLTVGYTYTFRGPHLCTCITALTLVSSAVTAIASSGLNSTATIDVTVSHSPLVANIEGGSSRLQVLQ